MRRHLTLMAVVVLLGACSWPMAGHGPERRGWSPGDTVITPANISSVTKGWTAKAIGHGLEPIADPNTVIQVGQGTLTALDRASGAVRWSVAGGAALTPALRGDALLTTAAGCSVQTRSLATGAPGPTAGFGALSAPGGFSVCGIDSSVLVTGSTALISYRSFASGPAIHCGTGWALRVGLIAFDEKLAPTVDYRVESSGCGTPPPEAINAPAFGDAASDGTRFFVPRDVTVMAMNTSGTPLWVKTLGQKVVGSPVVLANGDVAVTDVAGAVTSLDPLTGAIRWSSVAVPTATGAFIGAAATDSAVFLGGSDGVLRVYAAAGCGSATCAPTWTGALGHTSSARPSIAGDLVYVPSNDGALVAFDARGCGGATCTKLATLLADHPITAPPTIVGGRIIVATASDFETFALPN